MKLEVVNGYSMITRGAYRSTVHLVGEPVAVSRVVYKNEDGKLYVRNKGTFVEVFKCNGRYYEKREI